MHCHTELLDRLKHELPGLVIGCSASRVLQSLAYISAVSCAACAFTNLSCVGAENQTCACHACPPRKQISTAFLLTYEIRSCMAMRPMLDSIAAAQLAFHDDRPIHCRAFEGSKLMLALSSCKLTRRDPARDRKGRMYEDAISSMMIVQSRKRGTRAVVEVHVHALEVALAHSLLPGAWVKYRPRSNLGMPSFMHIFRDQKDTMILLHMQLLALSRCCWELDILRDAGPV
jgi:hypothetical protein